MSAAKRFPIPLLPPIVLLVIALCRILGPSDLYDKEQPRTISYTADMLLHHRWILPTDNFDIPATKPPFFNWISLPVVSLFGYQEWTLKFPSLLAAAIVLLGIRRAAKFMPLPQNSTPTPGSTPAMNKTPLLAVLASLMWLSTFMTAKLMYLARPDMLVTACLTLAWIAATEIIHNPKPRLTTTILLWLSITAAALAKGPIALLPIAYLVLAARFFTGSFQPLKRAGLWWGIPLLLATFGAWCLLAYFQFPEFFREVLLEREVTQRLLPNATNPHRFGLLLTLPNGPLYILSRFLPWSLIPFAVLVFGGIKHLTAKHRAPMNYQHPLVPAVLWIAIIALAFCFLATKRPDRYAPVFPPLALIAAWIALEYAPKLRLSNLMLIAPTFVFLIIVILNNALLDLPATTNGGDNLTDFIHAIAPKVRNDTILFEDGEQTPLQTLLGRHQSLTPSTSDLNAARWAIRFYDPNDPAMPAAVSDPISQIDAAGLGPLALYPLALGEGPAEFQRAQKVPRLYYDDATGQLVTDPGESVRWLQFWRQHTAPATTQ